MTIENNENIQKILQLLPRLPEDAVREIVHYAEFLNHRAMETELSLFARLSNHSLAAIWDNEDDAEYDRL